MDLVSNAWHVFGAALVFFLGAIFSIKMGRAFDTSGNRSLALYLWHTLFCLVYIFYVRNAGGDALTYYYASLWGITEFSFGTAAVQLFTMFFSSLLGLSVLGTFLGYNLLGFIGLLAFDASLQAATRDRQRWLRRLATLIVLLPSVSFWSSAIGKDALSFMAAGLALWAAQRLRPRAGLMVLAVMIMLLVRPHMAALMVMALAVAMTVQPKVSIPERLLVGGFALAVAIVMVPLAMRASGLGADAAIADISEYIDNRQSHNMQGGGGVDISSMSLPVKLFTYLFRPLPFEAHNLPALAASIDNVVLLFLGIAGLRSMFKGRTATGSANRAFLWIYAFSALLILALTTANLGISLRQKWMFVPMLIFLLISVMGRPRGPAVAVAGENTGSRITRQTPP